MTGYGILLCFDEVITGFGRLGHWFASERFGVTPDLITSAKGLSSAYAAIGALVASERVMEPFLRDGRMYLHGMTFGGHPVQAAVALKNIEIMRRERIVEHVRETEGDFRAALEQLLELPIVGDLRGAGFLYALELVKDKETRASFSDEECDELLRGFVSPRLFEEGLLCRADDRGDPVVQISPPLVAGQAEFDAIAGTLGTVLEEAGRRMQVARVSHDAIVVGGGHNGLTCAAYLARSGSGRLRARAARRPRRRLRDRGALARPARVARVVRRLDAAAEDRVRATAPRLRLQGRAARPELRDLRRPTARPIFFFYDAQPTQAQIARYSRKDAAAYPGFEELLARAADFLRPLLLRPPPALGSKRPGDLLGLLREAARAAGLARRDLHELFRVMTMPVGDLLDDWFETDALKGAIASTGVVGVWAGPRTPGTAYNLLHHELGELNGIPGAWGHVQGGMGGISGALARSAEAHGATIRTGAAVRSIDTSGGHITGVTLDSGEELRAPLVVSGAHPRTTILDLVGAEHFPDEVADDMRRFRSRGGSVKINCILSEPPRYEQRLGRGRRRGCFAPASPSARRSTASSAPGRTPFADSPPRSPTSRSRCRRASTPRSPTTAAPF